MSQEQIVKSLQASFEAAKQMFNEAAANALQVRSQNMVLMSQLNELNQKVSNLEKSLEEANAKLAALPAPEAPELKVVEG